MYIFVKGQPFPKERPRYSAKFKRVVAFTPKRTADWEKVVRDAARLAMGDKPPIEEQVGVSLVFRRGDRRNCDIDNLAKAVLDAFNKIVIKDDKQIMGLLLLLERGSSDPGVDVYVDTLTEWSKTIGNLDETKKALLTK